MKGLQPNDTITCVTGHKAELYHGDGEEVVANLANVQAVITDPPYLHPNLGGGGCFAESNQKVVAGNSDLEEICSSYNIDRMFDLWIGAGAENIVCFCSNLQIRETIEHMERHDLRYTVMVWHKYNACPMVNNTFMPDAEYIIVGRKKGAYMNNDVPTEWKSRVRRRPMERERNFHPTAKPVGLLIEFISVLCPKDGTVLDSFMGSGSTGIAALKAERNFIGVELQDKYYPLAVKEISKEATQNRMF